MYIYLVISDYKTKNYLSKGFFNIVQINFIYYLKKYNYLKTISFILLFRRKKNNYNYLLFVLYKNIVYDF